jgi:hypothetical protein
MTYTKPTVEVLGRVHALTLVVPGNGCQNSTSGKPCGTTDGRSNITGWS